MGISKSCSVTLYCDGKKKHSGKPYHDIHGTDLKDCLELARSEGWVVDTRHEGIDGSEGFGFALCPECAGGM